ncbi:MAG: hypothetical protein KA586_06310 [Candidatus Promineofilum sp.]|nr:hypothetical protein [Promineifilum sp.]
MLNESRDPTKPEQFIANANSDTAETAPVDIDRLRVYERPARPVLPAWIWLLILLAGALLVWVAIQALQ